MAMFNLATFLRSRLAPHLNGMTRSTSPDQARAELLRAEAIVTETIQPHKYGRVYYQGTWWFAYCHQSVTIPPGRSVYVIEFEGIRLVVEPVIPIKAAIAIDDAFFMSPLSSPCGKPGGVHQPSKPKNRQPQDWQAMAQGIIATIVGVILLTVSPGLTQNREYRMGAQFPAATTFIDAPGDPDSQMPDASDPAIAPSSGDYCRQFSVDPAFCQEWLREAIDYADYWQTTDNSLLQELSELSLEARAKLHPDFPNAMSERDHRILRSLNLSELDINEQTDILFFQLFPRRRYQALDPSERYTHQVWFACREAVMLRLEQKLGRVIQ